MVCKVWLGNDPWGNTHGPSTFNEPFESAEGGYGSSGGCWTLERKYRVKEIESVWNLEFNNQNTETLIDRERNKKCIFPCFGVRDMMSVQHANSNSGSKLYSWIDPILLVVIFPPQMSVWVYDLELSITGRGGASLPSSPAHNPEGNSWWTTATLPKKKQQQRFFYLG